MDQTDRALLTCLQQDATQSYAALGQAVGLSAGAAHERVRKLRERGVIRRTTVEVDPAALGDAVLAYVMVDSVAWMGDSGEDFAAIPEVLEAHVIMRQRIGAAEGQDRDHRAAAGRSAPDLRHRRGQRDAGHGGAGDPRRAAGLPRGAGQE